MAVWVVRAGEKGESEKFALKNNVVFGHWNALPDLSGKNVDEIKKSLRINYPGCRKPCYSNWAYQLYKLVNDIRMGDYVLLPLKKEPEVAIGKIMGDYQYHRKVITAHRRPVKWLNKNIPRTIFQLDFQEALKQRPTIFQVKVRRAEKRLAQILSGKVDPLLRNSGPEPEDLISPGLEDPGRLRFHKQRERNQRLAKDAKKYHGHICQVCGFDFGEFYGELGRGYIEAHHLVPISELKRAQEINPKKDMTVICANCHRMIHRERNMSLKVPKRIVANSGLAKT